VVAALLAAGVLVVAVAVLAWLASARRRSQLQNCVTEEQARANAAPLTTAILSASRDVSAPRRDRR
jgi:hypothetical protein